MIPVNRASLEERRKHLYRNVKKAEDETFGAAVTSTRRESFLLVNAYLARATAAKYAENDKITIDEAFLIAKNYYETAIRKEDISFVEDIEFGFEFDEEEEAVLKGTDEEAVKELIAKAIFIAMLSLIEEYNGAPIKTIEDFKIKNLKTPKAKRAKEYLLDELSSDEDEAGGYFSFYVLNQKRKIVSDRMPRIKFDDQGKEEPKEVDRVKKDRLIAKDENVMLRYLETWTYPLDLVNIAIFRGQPGEYMTLNAVGRKDKEKGKQADVFLKYDIENDENVTLTNQLTQFDKRVYLALSNLFIDGQNKVTAAHVYKEMTQNKPNLGKSNNIKQGQIEEIFKSIEKMRRTTLLISNEEEHKLYPQYPLFEGKFNLLEVRYATERVNGSIVDNVIHIIALPPLFDYALKKSQVTTISTSLLKIPHLQTIESNISLHDYLTIRIAQMKRTKETGTNRNKKATLFRDTILIKTIQDNCGFNSPKLKRNLPEKIEAILNEFKKQKFIKDYKWEEVKVRISL